MNLKEFEKFYKFLAGLIVGTKYENHTYLTGDAVRKFIFGQDDIRQIEIVVDLENGGNFLANFIAMKENNLILGSNPKIYADENYSKIKLNNKDFEGLILKCYQTRIKDYHVDQSISLGNRDINFGSVNDDSFTKDITIDSMYINVSNGNLLDNQNGIDDGLNKIARNPSKDKNTSFKDNPIKMIRIIRKASELNFGIEKETWFAIVKNCGEIKKANAVEIAEEFNKILLTDKPSVGLNKLMYSGLLFNIIPQAYALNFFSKIINKEKNKFENIWNHTLNVVDFSEPRLINRLAAFFHDIGKTLTYRVVNGNIHFYGHEVSALNIIDNIMRQYKYTDETINKIKIAVKEHMRFYTDNILFKPSSKSIKNFIKETGDELDLAIDLIQSDVYAHGNNANINTLSKIISSIEDEIAKDDTEIVLPINGNDIKNELGVKEGKVIGSLLNEIKNKVSENPNLTKEEAILLLKEKLALIV